MTKPQEQSAYVLAEDLLRGADAVAAFLGLSRRQVYHYVEQGVLPAFRLGTVICARKSSLHRWMDEQVVKSLRERGFLDSAEAWAASRGITTEAAPVRAAPSPAAPSPAARLVAKRLQDDGTARKPARQPGERFFTRSEVETASGVSAGTLQNWLYHGFFVPTEPAHGRGSIPPGRERGGGQQRRFSYDDVMRLAIMARAQKLGMSPKFSSAIADAVHKNFGAPWLRAGYAWVHFDENANVVKVTPERLWGNACSGWVLDLGAIRKKVDVALAAARSPVSNPVS